MIYTEKQITDSLHGLYAGNSKYRLSNAYIFKGDWESDFFVQKENGYCYEFEVKISRADFFKDKSKVDKHSILATGIYKDRLPGKYNPNSTGPEDRWIYEYKDKVHTYRPNRFFYVVPENMIKVEEVPAYAGLMYFNGFSFKKVKEAPFIHKEVLQMESVLCGKFYHYWLNTRFELRQAEIKLQGLEAFIKTKK